MKNDNNSYEHTTKGLHPTPMSERTPSTTTGAQRPTPPEAEASDPVIFTYSRKEALADGVQVDVTPTAKQCGFKIPVFLTASVYHDFVEVPEGVEGQDEAGRLWDILWMLYNAIRKSPLTSSGLSFELYVRNDNTKPQLVTLHAVCEALDFDSLEPAITITLPDED